MARKLQLENIRNIFLKSGCLLLEDSYKNNRTPLEYKCSCGKISNISYSNFQKGRRCNACGIVKRSEPQRLDSKIVFDHIESNGYKVISKKFLGVASKLDLICKNNHNVKVSYRSLKGNNFGCRVCFKERNRGENHHGYKHGMSDEDRRNRNLSRIYHNEWKKSLLKLYNFKCDICGSSNKMAAHHKNGYNWDIDNRYNVENGVILCKDHHDGFHLKYGKGWNTEDQYKEYKLSFQ